MDYLIKKSDGSVVEFYHRGTKKVKLPGQTGGDVVFVGDKRPLDLGDYFLAKAVEIEEPLDADTKRGPMTTVVSGETVTVTKTAVAKTTEDYVTDWENRMEESDRIDISREMEDHIDDHHGGIVGNKFGQAKYDEKKAKRAQNPG